MLQLAYGAGIDKRGCVDTVVGEPETLKDLFLHWVLADMHRTMRLKKYPFVNLSHRDLPPCLDVILPSLKLKIARGWEEVPRALSMR